MKPPFPLYDLIANAYAEPTKQVLAAVALLSWVALLLVCVPLFVCMPLTSDTVLYDLQARMILNGGVAYRDIFETNLPGMIWVHAFVRPLIGSSSVAIRVADLFVVGMVIAISWRWLKRLGMHTATCVTAGLAVTLFYVSTSEWCHCQRDTWMLIPALGALVLRLRTLHGDTVSVRQSGIEGALWALAFWIKPFTAVPGLLCIVASWMLGRRGLRFMGRDLSGVLFGGVLVGLGGTVWLLASGAWPHFWDTMTVWNPEYFAAGKTRWTTERLLDVFSRFQPWMWIHGLAVPVAAFAFFGTVFRRVRSQSARLRAMLAVFYLGWLVQSLTLQHLMDYIHVPAVMLAIVVLAASEWGVPDPFRATAAVGFFGLAVWMSPLLQPDRIEQWSACVQDGSTPEVRMALTSVRFPDFENMERVIQYLQAQGPRDHEVTCYNVHSIHIYDRLGLNPSTRYLSLSSLLGLFPARQDDILSALDSSRQRFIVTESLESTLQNDGEDPSDNGGDAFPWRYPVVFQAGTYSVHSVPAVSTVGTSR